MGEADKDAARAERLRKKGAASRAFGFKISHYFDCFSI